MTDAHDAQLMADQEEWELDRHLRGKHGIAIDGKVAYLVGYHGSEIVPVTDDGKGPTEEFWVGGVILTDLGRAEARRAGVMLLYRKHIDIGWQAYGDLFGDWPYIDVTVETFKEWGPDAQDAWDEVKYHQDLVSMGWDVWIWEES